MTKYEFPWREKNINFKNYIIEERKKYDELFSEDDFIFGLGGNEDLEDREYICLKATFCGIDSKRFEEYYKYIKEDDNCVYIRNGEVINKNKEAIARLQQIDFVEVLKEEVSEDEAVEEEVEELEYTIRSKFLIPKDIEILDGLYVDQILKQWVMHIADTCKLILADYSIDYYQSYVEKSAVHDSVNDLFNLLSVLGYKMGNSTYKPNLHQFFWRDEDQFLNDYLEESRSYHNEIQRNFNIKKDKELEPYFDNSYELDGRQEYLYFEATYVGADYKRFFCSNKDFYPRNEEYIDKLMEVANRFKDLEGMGHLDIEEETLGETGGFTVISKFNLPKNANIFKNVSIGAIVDQWAKHIEKECNLMLDFYDICYKDCSYRKNKRVNSEPYKVNDLFHILNILGYQITK